jgi:hypothetical protein
MDRRTLGDRASFHIEETGRYTKDGRGVQILKAFLRIKEASDVSLGTLPCCK